MIIYNKAPAFIKLMGEYLMPWRVNFSQSNNFCLIHLELQHCNSSGITDKPEKCFYIVTQFPEHMCIPSVLTENPVCTYSVSCATESLLCPSLKASSDKPTVYTFNILLSSYWILPTCCNLASSPFIPVICFSELCNSLPVSQPKFLSNSLLDLEQCNYILWFLFSKPHYQQLIFVIPQNLVLGIFFLTIFISSVSNHLHFNFNYYLCQSDFNIGSLIKIISLALSIIF